MASSTATAAPAAQGEQRPWWAVLIAGILAFIVGAILLWAPFKTKADALVLLTTVIGIWWLIQGIVDIVSMFTDHRQWGWKLFMGIVSIIAGGYILMYPIAATIALPKVAVLVLGIWGVMYGIVLIALAFRGGGWGSGLLGALGIIFGLMLIMNYSDIGMGLSFLWVFAIFALVDGAIMVVQSFRMRSA